MSVFLDMPLRVICADQSTRLAFNESRPGLLNTISWTCPATGVYYLRPAAFQGYGYYAIRTFAHTPNPPQLPAGYSPSPPERARDARDVFTSYSDNGGVTWSTPAMVNQDPPYYDNWLPEVAVTGNSRAFVAWYDFRDAAASKCGGESSIYAARSDDGAAWSSLGKVTDALSTWTASTSNVSPNQGDYISI